MHQIKLTTYFQEASKHITLIEESLEELKTPLKEYEALSRIEKFALNALIFRFAKLQDLLGAKVFRTYLEYNGYNTQGISYYDILREIEKEDIVDIDTWSELRELRNKIAHDYPEELEEMIDSINLFINRSKEIVTISKKLESRFYETKAKRD